MSSSISRGREATVSRLQQEIAAAYPDLCITVRDGRIWVVGPFRLIEDSQQVDVFDVEIALPDNFPRGIPDVYEVGKRIPRDADHHMYSNGRACIFAPGERWRHWPRGSGLLEFLDGPVRSFFIGQALYELTGEWPFGQRGHGMAGIFEAYGEMLRAREPLAIARYLEVLARPKLRPRSPCPCGSGRPIHSCHIKKIADLRGKVSYRDARTALAIVLAGIKNAKQASTN